MQKPPALDQALHGSLRRQVRMHIGKARGTAVGGDCALSLISSERVYDIELEHLRANLGLLCADLLDSVEVLAGLAQLGLEAADAIELERARSRVGRADRKSTRLNSSHQ